MPRLAQVVLAAALLGPLAHAQLDLPQRRTDPQPTAPAAKERPSLPTETSPASESTPAPGPDSPASLFQELSRTRDLARVNGYVERLLALGPSVVPVARGELASEQAATLLAAGRVCLMGGSDVERQAVAERLTRPMPGECFAPLLEQLVERDPLLASPDYLAGLLELPGLAARTAAARVLGPRLSPASLGVLAPRLASERTGTRSIALDLVARVQDPAAWNLLASRLGDPSAQIAQRALAALAVIDAAGPLLQRRAFPLEEDPTTPTWDRGRAYALLTLVRREETRPETWLGAEQIPPLRAGLTHAQPLVAGACAVALARIGFRTGGERTGSWLDREVPHQLVRAGTGADFHNDFSSLEGPALRALALLSGESFGADGEAWRRWWVENAAGFHARHAVIDLPPDAADRLALTFKDAGGRACTLLGPLEPAPERAGRVIRLERASAAHVLEQLEGEGVFGMSHLPDPSGGNPGLAVVVGEQEKRFARAPWLEDLLRELDGIAAENRWQLYRDPAHASAEEWWLAEHERWAAMTPLARQTAMKELLIGVLRRSSGAERDEPLADLAALYAQPGIPAAGDFEPLLALLASELAFGARAETLCELARVAAASEGFERPEARPRERLIGLALERFGPEADASLARVSRDLDPTVLRQMATDTRPRARALAAAGLVRDRGEETAVLELLADPDALVRLAVLAALADSPLEAARAPLLSQARSGSPELRAAALRALEPLGGSDVRAVALESVGDPATEVQVAGVATLATLADASCASLFSALIARGPASPLYAAARRGLKRLHALGIEECLRMARSAGARGRREAALLLSEALAPEAARLLLGLVTEDPGDTRVVWELSVLSGLDLTSDPHPEKSGWAWWDLVVHDDPTAWLLAAAERAGVSTPPRAALAPALSHEGARFLLALLELPQPVLCERAARELERAFEMEVERPSGPGDWGRFRSELHEAVRARFGE